MPRYIIADRRDLLGGRLIPILNGLRLARHFSAKFLTTWQTGQDNFQSLVTDLPDILRGPFEQLAPGGYLLPLDSPLIGTGSRDVVIRKCAEIGEAGIHDFFGSINGDDDIIVLDRRFTMYSVDSTEQFSSVRQSLSQIFWEMPWQAAVFDTLQTLKEKTGASTFSSIHSRRLHLCSDTHLQVNRFDSYFTTETYKAIGSHILKKTDALLIASDSRAFVEEMKAAFPGKAFEIGDFIKIDYFSGIQRALLDMAFLGMGKVVYGPLSAYGVIASIVGNISYRNVSWFATEQGLFDGDSTRSIRYLRAANAGAIANFAEDIPLSADDSALAYRISTALASISPHDALLLAARGLAMRFCSYAYPAWVADYGHFLFSVKHAATRAGDDDAAHLIEVLENIITKRIVVPLPEKEDKSVVSLISIAILSANGDVCGDARYYESAMGLASKFGINTRGIILRSANLLLHDKKIEEAIAKFQSAIDADPKYADSWHLLSMAYHAHRQLALAIGAAKKATELDAEQGRYWYHLSLFLKENGDLDDAVKACKRACTIEPDNATFSRILDEI
ncbi:tetratricopeptide repeat protein [Nitrospirillum amazonense]|uniref:tetratricopeptide repeat protein n=1 Tax=Nitrospirillum amazonense TaxID=28077 RepID=UPI0024128C77|nr:tetratricopeptide repeat protein [Nitrospirillum amazonense]MDG3442652.1 tetratricopeptide repeat protein [Nitrospirillum amazonense]